MGPFTWARVIAVQAVHLGPIRVRASSTRWASMEAKEKVGGRPGVGMVVLFGMRSA